MILITVGHFVLFRRLLEKMDAYAATHAERVLIQVPPLVDWQPQHAETIAHIDGLPNWAKANARVVITHGAMTLVEMLEAKVPVICVPRRGHLKEHINDHQFSFAKRLQEKYDFPLVEEVDELDTLLADTPATVAFDDTERRQLAGFVRRQLDRWSASGPPLAASRDR